MKRGLVVALAALLSVIFVGVVLITGGGNENGACAATSAVSPKTAATHAPVSGYSGDQLANAAAIMNAGAALGVPLKGQIIGVMTAMGESGLRNIDYGDQAGPDSRGLFQQRDTWGTLAERMNPSQAATFFFQRLLRVPNWQSMTPTLAAHAVQINADPNHYTKWYDPATAVVTALLGGDAACAAGVSGDAKALAAHLVELTNQGKITWLTPSHFPEVKDIAAGKTVANCGIDTRILQVITIASNTFPSIGISDINRRCTNQIEGAGSESAHYVNGGGHAVDFFAFGGVPTTGADANAIKMLHTLAPLMAAGSAVGQEECRASAGSALTLPFNQFDDTCNHLHVQVDPKGDEPMKLTNEGMNQ